MYTSFFHVNNDAFLLTFDIIYTEARWMEKQTTKTYQHVCPRNCPSACTIISYIENNQVKHITGDTTHPYTNGKLCAKGFSYIEQNYHQDRLKYPYYQKVKGSGKFKQITWEKAYELITNELIKIHTQYGNFLPLALYKGFGNIGIHHDVTEKFFSSLGETTKMIGASPLLNRPQFFGKMWKSHLTDPAAIVDVSIIIIWGANPATSNIHLIPYLIKAKIKGAKIVVIDPLYTQTVELADLFIQLRPNTDAIFTQIIMRTLIEANKYDAAFIEQHTSGFSAFFNMLKEIDVEDAMKQCDVPNEALTQLSTWLMDAEVVSYIVGTGIRKHANSEDNIRAIETLAIIRGDIGKRGGGLFFKYHDSTLFTQLDDSETSSNHRMIHLNELSYYTTPNGHLPIEMLWISCGNPLIQEVNPNSIQEFMADVPFVVTVERFMTPTAHMSNLVLPTTSHFEETDIIISNWHSGIALNEKAVSPYFESKSEWSMMTELALILKKDTSFPCTFPIYSSEKEYLNAQFNDQVVARYHIKNLHDLKSGLNATTFSNGKHALSNDDHFYFTNMLDRDHRSVRLQTKELTNEYPFWLITPHHPYMLNSQFHYLHLSPIKEAVVHINPKIGAELGIADGEVVRVFNEQASIQMKAIYSHCVPKDIVMIYQGWYTKSHVTINNFISECQSTHDDPPSPHNGLAFYDTFVNIGKI